MYYDIKIMFSLMHFALKFSHIHLMFVDKLIGLHDESRFSILLMNGLTEFIHINTRF